MAFFLVYLIVSQVLDPDQHARYATTALASTSVSQSETAASEPEKSKEAAAPAETGADAEEELPPYGDPNLPREETLRGRVVDGERKPVPDAIVLAGYKDTNTRPYSLVLASKVRTDEAGEFVLGPLEKREHFILASKEDVGVAFRVGQRWGTSLKPGTWIELVLLPGGTIEGRVTVSGKEEPVAGARVLLMTQIYAREIETDADGRYKLILVPPTRSTWQGHSVHVLADGYMRAKRTNLLLQDGEQTTIDFELAGGGTLKGKVLDGKTHKPVAGAVIGEGWEPHDKTTTTNEEGLFELEHVDTAPNRIFTARAENYLPAQKESDGSGSAEFKLSASRVVTGTVFSPEGNPAKDARVFLHRTKTAPGYKNRGGRGRLQTTTDAEGRFSFRDVLPGAVVGIAFHEEYAAGESEPVEVPEEVTPEEMRVDLRAGLSVEGDVRDTYDRPLVDTRVLVYPDWRNRKRKGYKYAQNYTWQHLPSAYTDKDGRFKLRGLMGGSYYLYAISPEHGWASQRVEGVDGEKKSGIRISFLGASLSGVVLTADGEPVPEANINAQGKGGSSGYDWRWTQTDSFGRFKMAGLKADRYTINVNTGFGQADPLKEIVAGTHNLEIKLKPTQRLRGRVDSILNGRPVQEFKLNIRGQRGGDAKLRGRTNWSGTIHSPDGSFERPVAPGRYQLTVQAVGHGATTVSDILVERDVETPVADIRLDLGGSIRGTVYGQDGKPLPYASVNGGVYVAPGEKMRQEDRYIRLNDRADEEGRFFIRGVGPGLYQLNVRWGRASALAQVQITGQDAVRVDLYILPTGKVAIIVVDEEGNPVKGVWFSFKDASGRWRGWAQQTNVQGGTTSADLPQGDLTASGTHAKYVIDPFTVTVEPSKTITVRVVARKK